MTDILSLNAIDLSNAIAARKISAVDVMKATLARIDTVNPSVNAITSLRDADVLLKEARAADAGPSRGWLHGIPLAVKDLANAAGLATSMGSPIFTGQVAQSDDISIARLRAAGAIVIGKTNTPEFGLGSHSVNPVFGATCNPYDVRYSAGGSSGGAGVALATGMVCIADGSDMMGSLRNPAGWNNVYGMRPSWGLVPSEPRGDMFLHALATNGPMARSPGDLAALLDTMGGADPRQPYGFSAAATLPDIAAGAEGLRIGWLGNWGGAYAMEPGILDVCRDALSQMSALGVTTTEMGAPFDRDRLWQSWIDLRSFAVAGNLAPLFRDPDKHGMLKDTAIWETERGLNMSGVDVQRASEARSDWFRTTTQLFEKVDVLALPTAQMWPFDVTLDWPRVVAGETMDTYHRWMEVVIPASLIGLPAVAVPVGFGGPNDLPMGLQLIGPRGSDARLLQLAQAWHELTDWPAQRPPNF